MTLFLAAVVVRCLTPAVLAVVTILACTEAHRQQREGWGALVIVPDSYQLLVSTHIYIYLLTVADSYLLVSTGNYSNLLIATAIYSQLQTHNWYLLLFIYWYLHMLLLYLLTVADPAVAGAVAWADPTPSLALILQLAWIPAILGALTQLPWE